MTNRIRNVIIATLIATALLIPLCGIEGGAPGREVCINCEE